MIFRQLETQIILGGKEIFFPAFWCVSYNVNLFTYEMRSNYFCFYEESVTKLPHINLSVHYILYCTLEAVELDQIYTY